MSLHGRRGNIRGRSYGSTSARTNARRTGAFAGKPRETRLSNIYV
jgi:hypothetical protein